MDNYGKLKVNIMIDGGEAEQAEDPPKTGGKGRGLVAQSLPGVAVWRPQGSHWRPQYGPHGKVSEKTVNLSLCFFLRPYK